MWACISSSPCRGRMAVWRPGTRTASQLPSSSLLPPDLSCHLVVAILRYLSRPGNNRPLSTLSKHFLSGRISGVCRLGRRYLALPNSSFEAPRVLREPGDEEVGVDGGRPRFCVCQQPALASRTLEGSIRGVWDKNRQRATDEPASPHQPRGPALPVGMT